MSYAQGYFAGGATSGSVNTPLTDMLTFSSNTTSAQTSANLSQQRSGLAGVSNSGVAGYFAGGYSSGDVATADMLTFSSNTTSAQTSANLTQARQQLGGVSGTEYVSIPVYGSSIQYGFGF